VYGNIGIVLGPLSLTLVSVYSLAWTVQSDRLATTALLDDRPSVSLALTDRHSLATTIADEGR
jgi:hypothetical protein